MRTALLANLSVLGLLSLAMAGPAFPQNTATSPSAATSPATTTAVTTTSPATSGAARQKESSSSPYLLKAKTRLVTIDVVATDSRGNIVNDLKPEEFRILAGRDATQKVATFEFIGKPAKPDATGALAGGPGGQQTLSNQAPFQNLEVPPTVFLLDALNTLPENQIEARRHMLSLLNKLPANTPVALFLLTNRLRMVQAFTTDPNALRMVLAKLANANVIDQDPRDDPHSILNTIKENIENTGSGLNDGTTELTDFEREEFGSTVDLRVRLTTASLASIARSLSGISGRKNLVWMSEFFPTSIYLDSDFSRDTFEGTRNYASQVIMKRVALRNW